MADLPPRKIDDFASNPDLGPCLENCLYEIIWHPSGQHVVTFITHWLGVKATQEAANALMIWARQEADWNFYGNPREGQPYLVSRFTASKPPEESLVIRTIASPSLYCAWKAFATFGLMTFITLPMPHTAQDYGWSHENLIWKRRPVECSNIECGESIVQCPKCQQDIDYKGRPGGIICPECLISLPVADHRREDSGEVEVKRLWDFTPYARSWSADLTKNTGQLDRFWNFCLTIRQRAEQDGDTRYGDLEKEVFKKELTTPDRERFLKV
jgi:hypothetical protein